MKKKSKDTKASKKKKIGHKSMLKDVQGLLYKLMFIITGRDMTKRQKEKLNVAIGAIGLGGAGRKVGLKPTSSKNLATQKQSKCVAPIESKPSEGKTPNVGRTSSHAMVEEKKRATPTFGINACDDNSRTPQNDPPSGKRNGPKGCRYKGCCKRKNTCRFFHPLVLQEGIRFAPGEISTLAASHRAAEISRISELPRRKKPAITLKLQSASDTKPNDKVVSTAIMTEGIATGDSQTGETQGMKKKSKPISRKVATKSNQPTEEVTLANKAYNALPENSSDIYGKSKSGLLSLIDTVAGNGMDYDTLKQTTAAMGYDSNILSNTLDLFEGTAVFRKFKKTDPASISPLDENVWAAIIYNIQSKFYTESLYDGDY